MENNRFQSVLIFVQIDRRNMGKSRYPSHRPTSSEGARFAAIARNNGQETYRRATPPISAPSAVPKTFVKISTAAAARREYNTGKSPLMY